MIHLEEISGGNFLEVLRNLILKCAPNGEAVVKVLADYSVLFLILGIVVGISQCFFGYKLRKLWTALLLVIAGGCGSMALAAQFDVTMVGLIGLTAGMTIVGGLLGYFLWIVGCFLRPLIVISVAVFAVFVIYDMQTLGLIVGLAAGLIIGIVVAAFYRVGLILYSALFGGLLTGGCIWKLTDMEIWYPAFIIGGILALAGFGVQAFMNRKPKEETAGAEPDAGMQEGQPEVVGAAVLLAAAEEDAYGNGTGLRADSAGMNQYGTILQPDSEGRTPYGTTLQPDSAGANPNGIFLQTDNTVANQYGTIPQADNTVANQYGTIPQADGVGTNLNGTVLQPGSTTANQNGTLRQPDGTNGNQNGISAAAPAQNGNGTASNAGFCPSCGTPCSARAKFCMQCGQKLHL